jgi:hypothetical protein
MSPLVTHSKNKKRKQHGIEIEQLEKKKKEQEGKERKSSHQNNW